MRVLAVLGIVMVLLACGSPTAPGRGATAKFRTVPDGVPDLWIVILDPRVAGPLGPLSQARALATDLTAVYGGTVQYVYDYVLNGFSLQAPESVAVNISRDPRVASVQQAQVVRLADTRWSSMSTANASVKLVIAIQNTFLLAATF